MSATPIQLPSIPPEGPWDAYVLILVWLPLLFRFIFLAKPVRQVVKKFAPHSKWMYQQLKLLPIRGFGILIFNEIFAFLMPPMLVLLLRQFLDPIGWQVWSEVPLAGGILLFFAVILWIAFDFLRIIRVRKMMKAVLKHDIDKLRKVADKGMGMRGWLRKFSGKDQKVQPTTAEKVKGVTKSSLKVWVGRAIVARKFTPAGLLSTVAMGAAVEVGKLGAGKLSDAVDNKLQQEFEKIAKTNTKTLLLLFMRDLAMGIVPLVFLAVLPRIL